MSRFSCLITSCLMFTLGAGLPALAERAGGAESLREETSLEFVEQDVSFYASSLRNREQVERFLNSNAYAKLKAIPFYQLAALQVQTQWNSAEGPVAAFREVVESEEGQAGLAVLKEAVSEEVFLYGDANATGLLEFFQQLNRLTSTFQVALAEDEEGELEDADAAQRFLNELSGTIQELEIPTLVMGFRVQDTDQARAQLDVIERLARQGLQRVPGLEQQLERVEIGSGEFLTLKLSGALLPWEDLVQEDIDEELHDEIETIKTSVSAKEFIVAFGLRGQYLLLSVSQTTDALKLPESPQLLIDRSEMARVREFADRPLTSINYVSAEFMNAANNTRNQLEDMKSTITAALKQSDLDADMQEKIIRDVNEFAEDVNKYIPDYGTITSFQFMTDDGLEGYAENWMVPDQVDGSQKLDILEHAGGRPLLVVAGRSKTNMEEYEVLVKWSRRVGEYLRAPELRDHMDEDMKKVWDHFQEHLPAMSERFNTITRDLLLPALADGQAAIVLDAQLASTQWHRDIPMSDEALPLPTFSLLLGVSDADKLRQALADYWSLAGDLVRVTQEFLRENEEQIREDLDGAGEDFLDAVLQFEWKFPEISNTRNGEIFQLPLPEDAGVDAQIVPSLGVGEDVAVASVSATTVTRLMQPTPLEVGGALSDVDRPLAYAVYVDFAGMIEVLKPWIGYVVDVASDQAVGPQLAVAEPQVISLLEVFQSFGNYTSATTVEGDKLLTHQKWRFQDAE